MSKKKFLLPLATSVATLLGSIGVSEAKLPENDLLKNLSAAAQDMNNFIERNESDGLQMTNHRSHYSHRSHHSHRSHYSHYSSRY